MFSGESVSIVNRTSGKDERELFVMFNGRTWKIPKGVKHGFPIEMVKYAKDQNPIMGSENLQVSPNSKKAFRSLIGVQGVDDCSPVVESKAIERIDRTTAAGIGQHAKSVMGTGDPSAFEARVTDIDHDASIFDTTASSDPVPQQQ